MKYLALAILLMALAGCMADQKQQVAACELEGMRIYPGEQIATSTKLRSYLQLCMTAHGYRWNLAADGCDTSFPAAQNPYCYEPIGRIAWLLSWVESAFSHVMSFLGEALAFFTVR